MKPSDFSKCLTTFFTTHLTRTRNLSENTIMSYRDTFRLLLAFCRDECSLPPEKISFKVLDEKIILRFLEWLQDERSCSIATRNQRLAAIHSFFRYAQAEEPGYLLTSQRIMQIPFKKQSRAIIQHLSPEQTRVLLSQPNVSTKIGRRDSTLLSVLYDTGARVQELCDLLVKDIRFEYPARMFLAGKGRKVRPVPMLGNTTDLLESYMKEHGLLENAKQDSPLFFNQRRTKLTRGGVSHILKRYAEMASQTNEDFPKAITPHILRHTKAMHLYQAGVNLVYIRDILGHVDISTTDIYARADIEAKRKALENVYSNITPTVDYPDWNRDSNILEFLKNL